MKILRVINSLQIGGAERSIATNVPIHIKNGYATDVLLLNGKNSFFYDQLKAAGVNVYSLGIDNNIYNPFLTIKLLKYVKNYDVIHSHLFPALYWVAFAKIISSKKLYLIYTEHSTENRRRAITIFKAIDRLVYSQYDKIISISKATSIALEKYLHLGDKIITIPNGVDFTSFNNFKVYSKQTLFKTDNDKYIITQIAGFRKEKDQGTLIRAVAKLPPMYHLVLVGDGERIDEYKQMVSDLNITDRVSFLGLREDIPSIIDASDIIVMSSKHEGFGRSVIEGMYLGKPIIASNVPGLADLVKDVGLLFPSGDDASLSALIRSLSEDKLLYQSLSEKSRKQARNFDANKMIKAYESVYSNVVGKH